jgi:CheY-like chemotaxis protein
MTDDPLSPVSILIVEDDMDGADSMAAVLELHGFRVTVARTGGAALDLAADDPPDVALLDIGLPGIDGWEVARWLRERHPSRRPFLVAVTGYATEEDRRRSEVSGIDLHLAKPVEPAVLVGVIRRFARVVSGGVPLCAQVLEG